MLQKVFFDSYKDQLRGQLASVREWRKLEGRDKHCAIRCFMENVAHLFLEYFQAHLDEAKEVGSVYDTLFWKNTVESINGFYFIELFTRLDFQNPWEDFDDVWARASWIRTEIEAFSAMFGDRAGNLDTEEIAEWMEENKTSIHGVLLPRGGIPENAPLTHWWWYINN